MTFTHEALIYLAVAVVMVPIASRLGLGSVLGYLIGGVLIGPHAIGVVSDVDSTMQLAGFGVVLMLFLIGLELDLRQLWSMRRQVFGGGALQVGACAIALGLGLIALGLPPEASLIIGISLALSSTPIAISAMAERHLDKTPVGRIALTISIFQDLVAIPLIALVPVFGQPNAAGQGGGGFLAALEALGAIVAVIVVGRFLTRPILRIIAKTSSREVFSAFALLLVVGIAELMTLVGLSAALGAFIAGVLLATSEYRHALESDLQPFKGLLLGLFFIAVGMSIDLSLFAEMPLMVIALTLGLVIIKLVAQRLVATTIRDVPASQRWLFSLLIVQGSEFAFVIFATARDAQILPDLWAGLLTLAVALSMAAPPLLLVLHQHLIERIPTTARDSDVEDEGAPVIIAGFGRVGQIIGRLLFASGIKATVLDHDPDQIELLKRFGFRIFYGDATRLDLLEAAGAHRARLLVVAIDDRDASEALVERVRAHFPKLRIIARARNVGHYTALRKKGVEVVERETFEGSLMLGRKALEALGCPPYEARERADRFRHHNTTMLETLLPHWDDEARRVAMANQARRALEEQMEEEKQDLAQRGIQGWHYEPDTPPRDTP